MNEKFKQIALSLLNEVKSSETETIQIDNTVYDDGSRGLTISVTYPATKGGEDDEQNGQD